MAEKVGSIFVTLDLDSKNLIKQTRDAEKKLVTLAKTKINVKTNVDSGQIKDVQGQVAKLNGSAVDIGLTMADGQLKDVQGQIASLDGRSVDLDTSVADGAVKNLEAEVSGLDGRTINFNTAVNKSDMGGGGISAGGGAMAGAGLAKFAAPAAALAGSAGLVMSASSLDTQARKIATVWGSKLTDAGIGQMRKDILALSNEVGISAEDLSQSIYNALSSGIPADNVFDFIKTAAKTSIGGATDLASVTKVLVGTTNAFSSAGYDAAKVSDILSQGMLKGSFEMDELVQSISQFTPVAAAMGVPLEDAVGWLAHITNLGTPTAQAATGVKAAFAELSTSTSIAGKNFKKITGKSFPDFIKGGGKLEDALKLMDNAAKKQGITVGEMFGSIEAGSAVMASTGGNMGKFTDTMNGMRDSAGATDGAYKIMEDGMGRSLEKLKTHFKNNFSRIADASKPLIDKLIPVMDKISTFLANAIEWFTKLPAPAQAAAIALGLVGAALWLIAGPIGVVELAIAGIVLLIGGFIYGLVELYNKNQWFHDLVVDTWEKIKVKIKDAWENHIKPAFDKMKEAWDNLIGKIKEFMEKHPEVVEALKFAAILIGLGLLVALDASLKAIIITIGTVSFALDAMGGYVDAASSMWDGMGKAWDSAFRAAITVLIGFLKAIDKIPKFIKDKIGLGGLGDVIANLESAAGTSQVAANETLRTGPIAASSYAAKGAKGKGGLKVNASGGYRNRFEPGLVGELGPELFVPDTPGHIISAQQTGEALKGNSITINVDMSKVMATSRAQVREVGNTFIEAVNEGLIARGIDPIAENKVRGVM